MESAPNPLGWLSPNQHSVFVFKENNDRHHCVELFEPNLVYEKSFLQVLSIGDLGKGSGSPEKTHDPFHGYYSEIVSALQMVEKMQGVLLPKHSFIAVDQPRLRSCLGGHCFGLLSLQTPHLTARQNMLGADQILYGCQESFASNNPQDPLAHMHCSFNDDSFLLVCNEGSAAFAPLSPIVSSIPFQQILKTFYEGDTSKDVDKRGNHQVNFGFACGQSHARRTPEMIAKHYGVSVPATLEGTKASLVLATFLAMSELAKATGVEWTQEEYLQEHPEVAKRLELFANTLVEGNVFEALTFGFLVLDGKAFVKEHLDKQNCPKLTRVLIASRIMKCDDGSFVRVSIIGYMRRSVRDCIVRRDAVKETAVPMLEFLHDLPASRLPHTTPNDFIEHGAGSTGVLVSCSKDDNKVTSVALVSRPSMNKDVYMLSSIPHALSSFRAQLSSFTLQEGVSILATLAYLPGLEGLVSVLLSGELLSTWQGRWSHPGGVTGLVLALITKRTGGINLGKHPRCQPFTSSDELDGRQVHAFGVAVTNICLRSLGRQWMNVTEKEVSLVYDQYLSEISSAKIGKKSASGVGLAVQHVLHCLALCGLMLPLELVHWAKMTKKAVSSRCNSLPAFRRYIRNKNGKEEQQRVGIFEESLAQFISHDVYRTKDAINHSLLENIACEQTRKDTNGPADLVFPGQPFYLPVSGPRGLILTRFQPKYNYVERRFEAKETGQFPGVQVELSEIVEAPSEAEESKKVWVRLAPGDAEETKARAAIKQVLLTLKPDILKAKQLCCIPCLVGETVTEHNARICGEVAKIPNVQRLLKLLKSAPSSSSVAASQERRIGGRRNKKWDEKKDTKATECRRNAAGSPPHHPQKLSEEMLSQLMRQPLLEPDADDERKPPAVSRPSTRTLEDNRKRPPPSAVTPDDADRKPSARRNKARKSRWGPTRSLDLITSAAAAAMLPGNKVIVHDVDTGDSKLETRKHVLSRKAHTESVFNATVKNQIEKGGIEKALPLHYKHPPDIGPYRTDWSAGNLQRVSDPVLVSGGPRRLMFPLDEMLDHMLGKNFMGLSGTTDLVKHTNVKGSIPNLLDLASNSVNSASQKGPALMPNLRRRDVIFDVMTNNQNGQDYFKCRCPRLPSLDYFMVKECCLCDQVAGCLGGVHFWNKENGGNTSAFRWGFPCRETARIHLLLCMVLTTGSGYFYTQLHMDARKRHGRAKKQVQTYNQSNGNKTKPPPAAASPPSRNKDRIVVCYGPENEELDPPFFYVVGNSSERNADDPRVLFDFCIAIPDRTFFKENFARGQRRPTRQGNALFVRPVHSKKCLGLLVQSKKPARKKTHSG